MMRDVPAYIKTVNNGELTMSLDILDDYATTEEILVRIKKIIKLMCPANVIYEEGNIGDMVGWFESKSNWEKITYYNLYFIIEKEGTKIFGNFQCLFERYDRWKPQIMNILCHLRTGRANYENFSEAMEDNRIITEGYKLVGGVYNRSWELISSTDFGVIDVGEYAWESAAWFWTEGNPSGKNLNTFVASKDWHAISSAINSNDTDTFGKRNKYINEFYEILTGNSMGLPE